MLITPTLVAEIGDYSFTVTQQGDALTVAKVNVVTVKVWAPCRFNSTGFPYTRDSSQTITHKVYYQTSAAEFMIDCESSRRPTFIGLVPGFSRYDTSLQALIFEPVTK